MLTTLLVPTFLFKNVPVGEPVRDNAAGRASADTTPFKTGTPVMIALTF